MIIIIIACGVGGAVLVFLVLVLVICCVWRHRQRTRKADFVVNNHSANHKSSPSADIELGKVTYKESQPSSKGVYVCACVYVLCVYVCIYVHIYIYIV